MKPLRLFFWNCGRILDGREKVAASSAFGPYLDGQFLPSLPHDFCILGLSPNGLQQRGALPQQVSPARRGGGGGGQVCGVTVPCCGAAPAGMAPMHCCCLSVPVSRYVAFLLCGLQFQIPSPRPELRAAGLNRLFIEPSVIA